MPQTLEATPPEVDKSPARVRSMFGEIAGRYDHLNHFLSLGVDKYWRWRTVRKVAPGADGPILDVCTGTGDLALAYRRAAPSGVEVIGADFCRPMLVIGRKKAQARQRKNGDEVRFVEADAAQLPFADDQFPIVTVAFGLRNVNDTDAALRELVRVCRPGGRVAILEFSMPRRQPLRGLYGWYFRHVLPRIGQCLSRNRHGAYNYLPTSVGQFPAGEELTQRMQSAGLSSVGYWPLTFGVATLYVGDK
jgi:demethylmenaquinone methyltransferase/2-methoxy-6-polyprenyl-1,4-benzoquinol methylase